ncbi:tryptophan synthase subunit alpha [Candidatus Hydrogenedentota bacterium]
MNRIDAKFEQLRKDGEKGFIPFIMAGDPNLDTTMKLVVELEKRGAAVVELGVPFSDPLADGIANQEAGQRGLASGTTLTGIFRAVKELRKDCQIPIVLYIYYNMVLQYGLDRFASDAKEHGVDGILALDLPPEEAGEYKPSMDANDVKTIFLLAPTSSDERIEIVSKSATGFLYYVSRTGVTGEREEVADSLRGMVKKIKDVAELPVVVGFGISTPEQAAEIASHADAAVVGSAIVRRIGEMADAPQLVEKIGDFAGSLVRGIRGE